MKLFLSPFAIAALALTAAPAAAHRVACGPVVHAAAHHRAWARPALHRTAWHAPVRHRVVQTACACRWHRVASFVPTVYRRRPEVEVTYYREPIYRPVFIEADYRPHHFFAREGWEHRHFGRFEERGDRGRFHRWEDRDGWRR